MITDNMDEYLNQKTLNIAGELAGAHKHTEINIDENYKSSMAQIAVTGNRWEISDEGTFIVSADFHLCLLHPGKKNNGSTHYNRSKDDYNRTVSQNSS